ncbi:hypothetical protein RESH_05113 [Rhodopirellula europaea SH398]|uniref:Uncharacterized protein n=1 Tax=Rhodopirellula europaea SH398 TaxID=1263868 RepID=M5RY70_9BACT|nr:hypothetical protein RESH_05113 [Rhodopirellula europaea SH398]
MLSDEIRLRKPDTLFVTSSWGIKLPTDETRRGFLIGSESCG